MDNTQEILVRNFLIQPLLFSLPNPLQPIIIIIPFKLNIFDILFLCPFSSLIVSLDSLVIILKAKQRRLQFSTYLRTDLTALFVTVGLNPVAVECFLFRLGNEQLSAVLTKTSTFALVYIQITAKDENNQETDIPDRLYFCRF